jgi:hypothetical protein
MSGNPAGVGRAQRNLRALFLVGRDDAALQLAPVADAEASRA